MAELAVLPVHVRNTLRITCSATLDVSWLKQVETVKGEVNDELTRMDLPSNDHNNGANNKKTNSKREIHNCVRKSQHE